MRAIPLQTLIFVLLLGLAGAGLLSIVVDRKRRGAPLLIRSGADPVQLPHLFKSAPFGLVLLDLQLREIFVNDYARDLFESDCSQGVPAWRVELEKDVAPARFQEQPYQRVLTLPAGQTISWWVCPLPRLTLLFMTDLTEQRRLQKVSQAFLSTLSHELRTPLTAILAHLDIISQPEVDEKTREVSFAIVRQETSRLSNLVQDALRLGRLEMSEALEKQPADLFLVAEAAVAGVIPQAEAKEMTISLEATAPLPQIFGDVDKLKQVFLNLLDNSLKYGSPGGQILVTLSPGSGGIRVVIQDDGPGIPPEHLSRVAERFYRVDKDNDVEGSGLGLAIVAEILHLHDATLEIESSGEGPESSTTASFLLPASAT
jgi:two-component system phosphate regulon sensor histidine kinase PhoR